MDTDAYAVFATEVGQAELDSMYNLGLKVPYLSEWADKQAASKRLAEGWVSDAEPASKRQRVELPQETAEPGSALAAKRKEYAAHVESLECARLDMLMAQERARLAREQAEAEAAIAADDRAVQPTHTTTATATTDIPCMLTLQSTSAMSTLPGAEAMRNPHTYANLPAQQRQAHPGGRRSFRGDSVAAVWKEWQYGCGYASVKSLLRESQSSGKMTWRGSGKGTVGPISIGWTRNMCELRH